jgi:hypothetical protein
MIKDQNHDEEKKRSVAKESVEKPIKKKIMFNTKETQKMLRCIKMNVNKFKWAKRVGLENLFTHLAMNYTTKGPITRFFTNLGRTRGWKNPRMSA